MERVVSYDSWAVLQNLPNSTKLYTPACLERKKTSLLWFLLFYSRLLSKSFGIYSICQRTFCRLYRRAETSLFMGMLIRTALGR